MRPCKRRILRQAHRPGQRQFSAPLAEESPSAPRLGEGPQAQENLNKALYAALGAVMPPKETGTLVEAPVTTVLGADKLGKSALEQYRKAEEFLRQGNWAEFGRALEELEKTLIKISLAKEGAK